MQGFYCTTYVFVVSVAGLYTKDKMNIGEMIIRTYQAMHYRQATTIMYNVVYKSTSVHNK